MGIIKPNDPKIIENTRQRREWEKNHPDRNWKSELSDEQIKEMERGRRLYSDDLEEKGDDDQNLIDYLEEGEQI